MNVAKFLKTAISKNIRSLSCCFCIDYFIKVCSVKVNTTWTTKNRTSSHDFSKKFKTKTLEGHFEKKKKKNLWIGNKKFSYTNFCEKNDVVSLKDSTFRVLQVLIKLIFRHNFQFSTFILQESLKWCLIFSYFSAVFEKWANLLLQELLFNHILKECYIPKDLQIEKKSRQSFEQPSSCTAENFSKCHRRYCWVC